MEQNQTKTLSVETAYAFGAEHGLQAEIDKIRHMEIEWDSSYTTSVRRGYIVDLFEKRGLFEEFKSRHWAYGNTPGGETRRRRFLRIKQRYEDFLAGRPEETSDVEIEQIESEQEFAAESDLRDFLANNPACIEPGLCLYRSGDRSGIEFPVESGFIDILAVDRQGNFVVIELKVGKGRNKTVGQLLYYMGWVDKNLGKGPCRGMIIAKEIPDDLMLAVQRVPGVFLFRYHLNVSVEPVSTKASGG